MRAAILSFLAIRMLAALAAAHPVAQGSMDITLQSEAIEIRARVSNEEAFIAEALGRNRTGSSALDQVWQRHGEYLLAHLHLSASGAPLTGKVLSWTRPGNPSPEALVTYLLRYELPAGQPVPLGIELRQDVLNELFFAPGNRWEATYVVRVLDHERVSDEGLLLTSREPLAFEARSAQMPYRRAMIGTFLRHGIAHILSGYDHLLFVSALILAVTSLWDLAKVVTAFTIAHTLTLALAVLDIVRVPGRVVEPIIAASIVFVALQNVIFPARSQGPARLAVAFGFGLFHGLGFAGGLLAAMQGMAGVAIGTAITSFSLGVEIGHEMVALPLYAILKIVRGSSVEKPGTTGVSLWTVRAGSVAICIGGMFYLIAALR